MPEKYDVTVVGAGIVGLSIAWALARRGAEVRILDAGGVGEETSAGNTGWVVPALSAPVSAPGSVKQGTQMLFARDNPFRIRPRASVDLGRWLIAFMRSAQPARFRAGAEAILALNGRTLELFDELAGHGVTFEMHRGGLIFLCLTEQVLDGSQRRFEALGYPGEIERLEGDALRALEPSVADAVVGGLHIKPERFVRPETLTRGLHQALVSRGVRVSERCVVENLQRTAGGWHVHTPLDTFESQHVVLAAGIWTRSFERTLGLSLPMQPGKGYSLTTMGVGTPPAHALFFVEAMIGAAPYDGAVRLAGMLELVGMDPRVDPRRVKLLGEAARTYLASWEPGSDGRPWAGLRPLPPDGLPIIGAVPGASGMYVATGHGMVGVTLAPATASLVAAEILDDAPSPILEPFRPGRF